MLIIILWLQPTCILQHCFVSLQSQSNHQITGINPQVQLLAVHAPISMGRIILLYRAYSLRHHALDEGVLCFVVPAIRDQTCSPLEDSASHMVSTTHWEVLNKPPTHREYCWLCDEPHFLASIAIHFVLSQPVPAFVYCP